MIFEVNRQDFRATRVAPAQPVDLEPGQVRLAVERWAFTTNNITYAVAGDMLDYWGFFPTEAPWGRIPGIGLGSVVESANSDIAVGGRYFGFYPMGSEHIVDAKPHGPNGFRDVGTHRANHAVTYTDFRNVSANNVEVDDTFDVEKADEYLLLWGMFMTSFLVDDMLGDTDFSGAEQTLVTSASSKTSISLASCLAARDGNRSVGLTSERNRAFVEELDLYDQVITYDEVDQLDATVASGLVDMAGNATVRAAIHNHFGDSLCFSTAVGMTHWDADPVAEALPGPTPEFFFAPGQRAKRVKEWGAEKLDGRIDKAFGDLLANSNKWLQVEHRQGPEGIEATYRELLEGQANPASGFVCSMHEEPLT